MPYCPRRFPLCLLPLAAPAGCAAAQQVTAAMHGRPPFPDTLRFVPFNEIEEGAVQSGRPLLAGDGRILVTHGGYLLAFEVATGARGSRCREYFGGRLDAAVQRDRVVIFTPSWLREIELGAN